MLTNLEVRNIAIKFVEQMNIERDTIVQRDNGSVLLLHVLLAEFSKVIRNAESCVRE